jgi:hypothetical protein
MSFSFLTLSNCSERTYVYNDVKIQWCAGSSSSGEATSKLAPIVMNFSKYVSTVGAGVGGIENFS